jgi:hypothetical protein
LGNGENAICIDWDHDLVAVVRWIRGEALGTFLEKLVAAAR